jgi:hypothetical protein
MRSPGCARNGIDVDILLRLEDAALALLAGFLLVAAGWAWWWLLVFFLIPDASMIGYALGPRAGALVYNVVHHRALAVGLYCSGVVLSLPVLCVAGAVLLFHSSVDRVLGYGLKFPDSFQDTHLGRIGRPAENRSND